jgi:CheY-like chemotaxis protein
MPSNVKTILLAEDDIDDQDFITEAFQKIDSSLTIHTVLNGTKVLPFLNSLSDEQLPQLILLDYNLPEQNGADVLEQLTSNSRYQAIPKIVWSTSNWAQYRNRCLELGACFYMVKPSDIQGIEDLAKQMIDLCQATA